MESTTGQSSLTADENLEVRWEWLWSRSLERTLQQIVAAESQIALPEPQPVCPIFRVREQVRAIKPELFEPSILRMGLLHSKRFENRETQTNESETSRLEKAEKFRLDMVTKFLEILPAQDRAGSWLPLSMQIVPQPYTTKSTYYKLDYMDDVSDNTVLNALTLDAMILVQFGYVQQFTDSNADRSFQDMLFLDIIKLENQIPLPVLRRAIRIRFSVLGDFAADVDEHYVNKMCQILIQRLGSSLPGFYGKLSHSSFIHFQLLQDCDHLLAWVCKLMHSTRPTSGLPRLDSQELPPIRTIMYNWVSEMWINNGIPLITLLSFPEVENDGWAALGKYVLLALKTFWAWELKVFMGTFFLTPGVSVLVAVFLLDWIGRAGIERSRRMSSVLRHNVHQLTTIPSASHLREVGVEFKGITFEDLIMQNRFSGVDIVPKFKVGFMRVILYIPSFSIQNFTELLWRNMIAYEMKEEVANDSIYFMQFMGEVISTKEDVQILRNGRPSVIRQNCLDEDKQVVDLFNSLLQHYRVEDSSMRHWVTLRRNIKEFYFGGGRQSFHKAIATFVEPYEENPVLYMSLLAAFSLGVLQFCYIVFNVLNMFLKFTKP